MMMFDVVQAYEALRERLPQASRPINAAALQGLMAAMALAPMMVMPSVWSPLLWGFGADPAQPELDEAQFNQVMGAVMQVHNGMQAMLGPQRETHLRPCYHYQKACSLQDFCVAFEAGRRLRAAQWAELERIHPAWFEPMARAAHGEEGTDPRVLADSVEVSLMRLQQHIHGRGADEAASLLALGSEAQRLEWVLDRLLNLDNQFPFAAVEAARTRKPEVAEVLLQRLQKLAADPELDDIDSSANGHDLAAALLAEWRDARAFEPLLAMASFSEPVMEELWGDSLPTLYMRALASTCNGRQELMRQPILNPLTPAYTRTSLLQAWLTHLLVERLSTAPWEALALEVCAGEAMRLRSQPERRRNSALLSLTVQDLLSVGNEAARQQALQWHAEGLFERFSLTMEDIEQAGDASELRRQCHYIYSAEGEIAWWACYFEHEEQPEDWEPEPAPIVRSGPKVGRNEPCPCGSGRKYKKCHGAN